MLYGPARDGISAQVTVMEKKIKTGLQHTILQLVTSGFNYNSPQKKEVITANVHHTTTG